MSKFGDVSINKWGGNRGNVRLNEFINADLAYLYRPRDDQGLNLGKKLPSYSLDFVSDEVLGKKKLDYKSNNLTLDQFYELDPVNYLLYNIIDVCLCVLIDRKLKHIDQYNMYRRLMNTSFGESLRGSTALFDTLVLYNLTKEKSCVRYGLNEETTITINKQEIDEIPKPLASKDIKWTINTIDQQTYLKITRKFEGA
jgi:DNA polymerase elongation subunit (family B)